MGCIYLKDTPNLTYVKQEHIFPAGLGGTKKLPKGMVSDKANEIFSSMEKVLMESSLIAMMRMHYGPGKRGALSKNKASQSIVTVSRSSTGLMELTYTALSQPFSISQFTKDKGQYHISLRMPKEGETEIKVFNEFCEHLRGFESRFVHLQSKKLSDNQIIIGVHNEKFYCASNGERPHFDYIKREIGNFLANTATVNKDDNFEILKEQVTQFHRFEENSIVARMYGKTAINVLAHLKGEEFVKAKELEEFKNWIIKGEGNLYYTTLPRGIFDEKIVQIFPSKAHWCLFTQHDGYPYVMVCFYGTWQRSFKLTQRKHILFPMPQGYICDWKNKKEYELNEYINNILISKFCKDEMDNNLI